ncbi:MAG: sn-glycerol-3-phosphate ABC transporter ATP-binding protein UgpC [Actinobacteria bacterium]|nr:sn-glycerol-3-phosphate ABC transporter ATP-binding protein UgpC [Actinomycetota bacterium]
MAEITLEEVAKTFPDGTEAVSSFDLDIADGSLMVLVGPSGCGKTTLLRMVAGLEDITAGQVRIGGKVVNEIPPKDRDIAMVFQNYALYPHMSVYDNIGYGLKLRKVNKRERDRLIRQAARTLGLGDQLLKKPRALSGGQRQRVAMGRAIVRQPEAFLMDEPLSNLDAKLRVQMRTEISRIQRDVQVTTIYVTHDQTEAMTMGDRVAVMKKGELQQVDAPQSLYEHPENLFVAGFIGSPSMNLVEAALDASDGHLFVEFGGTRLHLGHDVRGRRRGIEGYIGRRIILGIRPEDMEDASMVGAAPIDRRMLVTVDVKEAMGSEIYAHFEVDAPPVLTEDTKELAIDAGEEVLEELEEEAGTNWVARLNPRTRAREGGRVELVVDTQNLHFFDAATGAAIYENAQPETPGRAL